MQAGKINRSSAEAVASYLQTALKKGFKADFTMLPFGSPRHELLAQLHYNVGVFAAFKNHSQVREMVAALVNEDGKIRSFSQFKKATLAINERYNVHWLRAEYQTAVLQGQAAAKWQRYTEDADLFPNLRYSAVQDSRTRPQHKAWHGIVRPVGDPFWNTHYPPNGWNCRCTIHQTTDPEAGEHPAQKPSDPFRINAGKTGLIVSTKHPYYKGTTKTLATQAKDVAIDTLKAQVQAWARDNLLDKTFTKDGLQARFTPSSLERILQEPHTQKYHQLLSLYNFERLLERASLHKSLPKERYYQIDIHDVPSLISLREEARTHSNYLQPLRIPGHQGKRPIMKEIIPCISLSVSFSSSCFSEAITLPSPFSPLHERWLFGWLLVHMMSSTPFAPISFVNLSLSLLSANA